jgi:histidyl-tRNA synthetase
MTASFIPEDQHYAFIQAIDKSEREPREVTAAKIDAIDNQRKPAHEHSVPGPLTEKLSDEVFEILDNPASAKSARLDTVETGLRHRGLGDFVKRDYTVVRGLAYYTGVVFEVFDRSGEFRAIAGGGRYDTLLKNLGGVDLPALGFGMGDVVLGEILKAKQWVSLTSYNRPGLFVAIADENFRPRAMKLIQDLRELAPWPVHYSIQPVKLGKQLQQAEDLGCCFAVVVDAEIEKDQIGLKDLATREQKPLTLGNYQSLVGFWIQKINENAQKRRTNTDDGQQNLVST